MNGIKFVYECGYLLDVISRFKWIGLPDLNIVDIY